MSLQPGELLLVVVAFTTFHNQYCYRARHNLWIVDDSEKAEPFHVCCFFEIIELSLTKLLLDIYAFPWLN
jgi:hypothetical protein